MEAFIWKSNNGIKSKQRLQGFELSTWSSKLPGLTAGFSDRYGGVSLPPYDSLNLALHVGDEPKDVLENRRRLANELGFDLAAWTCGEQVHGTRVAVVTSADKGRGSRDRDSAFQQTDGLVTNCSDILLTSFYADCVPLYFLDPTHGAIGLAHAGWKGTVGQIAVEVVETMKEAFGTKPEELLAAIGPSIGECCYEVDERVMDRVKSLFNGPKDNGEPREEIARIAIPSDEAGRWMLNLKELNRIIMIKAGILPTHIECTTWCTSCHRDKFFSYRKENGCTGRMVSWIGMKER